MDWIYLITAGFLEIGFSIFLKLTHGFTRLVPTLIFFFFSISSFWCLNKAIVTIPIGIAYAVWTGIGASGTVIVSWFLFHDTMPGLKLFFLVTLIASIIGLKILP